LGDEILSVIFIRIPGKRCSVHEERIPGIERSEVVEVMV
jgi:hypothetical protein